MKLHAVEIRHVRQIRTLTLDVSAPLTIVAGPNGVGKTTVQEAVLAALFYTKKETRDSFLSQFDPDSPPTVVLRCSRGQAEPAIELVRTLTDDKGEWRQGASVLKKKKEALDKIQQVLPISADAAALLLWGGQKDMTAVLESFPSDGHDLLTAATIKGAGPDPKAILADLEHDVEEAKRGERGGRVVGALTEAKNNVEPLKRELDGAYAADQALKHLRNQFEQAKSRRDQVKHQLDAAKAEGEKLAQLETLLAQAVEDAATLSDVEATKEGWDSLDEEIAQAQKELAALQAELQQLHSEYRVARQQELSDQIKALRDDIKALEEMDAECAALQADLKSKNRPDADDLKKLEDLRRQIQTAQDRMEASGVRYELSVCGAARSLRIAEDADLEKHIILAAGQPPQCGIVGHAVIDADGLRLAIRGKEDISRHRQIVEKNSMEVQDLLKRFAADDEAAFRHLANERSDLSEHLEKKRTALKLKLGKSSLPALKGELRALEEAQTENNMTLKDKERCAGRVLPPAAAIKNHIFRKEGEIAQGKEALRDKEAKRPTAADRALFQTNLLVFRKKARQSAAAFQDADEAQQPPTSRLLAQTKANLKAGQHEQARLADALTDVEKKVSDLGGQLKQVGLHRALAVIASEVQEAEEALHREEVLQEARALLSARLGKKIEEMTAEVPVDLGRRITQQLMRLTHGWLGRVRLDAELRVADVGENGALREGWRPQQLSHGERHQAALAVKIAVARALAATHGPVFIMLDDSLVTFDPERRASTEELLLDLVADGQLQVILFTCHTDWASRWKKRQPDAVHYVELSKVAQYYRARPNVVVA